MCTLSWLSDGDAYHVFFNRDEQRTRRSAHAPQRYGRDGAGFLAPLDPLSRGTWLAATDRGVTFGLLNRYEAGRDIAVPANRQSRGGLIMDLAGAPGSDRHVVDRLVARDLTCFEPFVAVGVDADGVSLVEWDGFTAQIRDVAEPGLVLTTSSHDPAEVAARRTTAFTEAGTPTVDGLRAVHRSHRPGRNAYSVCMHRDDAGTVSLTHVTVSPNLVTMRYVGGAPCQDILPVTATLPRLSIPVG